MSLNQKMLGAINWPNYKCFHLQNILSILKENSNITEIAMVAEI